jgi:two-component system sensor histidine kinase and response regulator WspE
MSSEDLSQFSMIDLFRQEVEDQAQVLITCLLVLEREPTAAVQLESCMRAAHSLKGAARIVRRDAGVSVAHVMEDCLVEAQQGRLILQQRHIDLLLQGVDLLLRIARAPEQEAAQWAEQQSKELNDFINALERIVEDGQQAKPEAEAREAPQEAPEAAPPELELEPATAAPPEPPAEPAPTASSARSAERMLRVTAEHLNRLLALAGEALVESRRLAPFGDSLLRLKRLQGETGKSFGQLSELLSAQLPHDEHLQSTLADLQQRLQASQQFLTQRLAEFEQFDRHFSDLSFRLYNEAVACRMRPFSDGVQSFPRMVRDLARMLGKQVTIAIRGEATQVDRDILEKLDTPLGHLLRNAVDHGIETPEERSSKGKSPEGRIQLEAHHSAGMLLVTVSDDGRGIDLDELRLTVVARQLTNAETAAKLSEAELLAFLFLPGFSMREAVTEISGRGVGLDAVQDMVKQVRGSIRVMRQEQGLCFQLQLPLTLSVVRTLLVDIGGESYAFPLTYITRTLKLPKEHIALLEGRQHFLMDEQHIGLVTTHQVLGRAEPERTGEELPIVVVSNNHHHYGLLVDRFLGERELVVQPLDARLGKIKDISAGALMEDGSPVLIVDVEDLIRSVEKLVTAGQLSKVAQAPAAGAVRARKRILVVDDSLTVRELERKLLGNRGYEVEVAVDGMDGWNAVRTGHFDLVVTDIDMPRLDGIELVMLIKKAPHLKSLPTLIVSYKDREEDRRRGLEAGADYYLTKGSFHDETLLQAVEDLIGLPDC